MDWPLPPDFWARRQQGTLPRLPYLLFQSKPLHHLLLRADTAVVLPKALISEHAGLIPFLVLLQQSLGALKSRSQNCLSLVLTTLSSDGLAIWVPRGQPLPQADTLRVLMNWKMPFFMPQATETNSPRKANLLAAKTDLNY